MSVLSSSLSRRSLLRGVAATGAAALASGALSGCGGDASSGEKVFRFAQQNGKQGYDLQKVSSSLAASIADAVTEPLVWWNEDLELVPMLCEELPSWSEDGLTLSCKLKEGVTFHNGAALTTADVKYTFERMFKPETAALSTYLYDSIEGAKEMLAGESDELPGLIVEDDYSFQFKLTQPYVPFLSNLGTSYATIFPHEACEEAGSDWGHGTNLIGTGPYKLTANDESSQAVLEKFEDWHGGTPNLDRVEVSFIDDDSTKMMSFANGDIDACDLSIDLLQQYKDDEQVSPCIHSYMPLGCYFFVFNMTDPAFSDVRVRKAISLAINREEMVSTLLSDSAQPATCFLNPLVPGYTEDEGVFPYDPEQAASLLDEAGFTAGEDGTRGITLSCETRSGLYDTVAVAVQGYLAKVGISMEVSQVDNGTWSSDWTAGNLSFYSISWNTLFPDADMFIYSFFSKDAAAKKSSFYENAEFNELIEGARVELDEEKRILMYAQADHILTREDYACVPLFYQECNFVAKDNVDMKVGNLIYHFNDVKMK